MSKPQSSRRGATPVRRGDTHDHDHGYKLLFSHGLLVEELLRGFLGEDWVGQLDFSSLTKVSSSFVSDDLRERHDDLIWKLRWKGDEERWFWIYLVLEFQSTPDPFMPVRLAGYVSLLLQELIRQGKLRAGDRLPPVVPLVLYNGKIRWRAPLDLASLFEEVPPGLKRYLPQLRYLLIDEGRLALDRPDLRENLAAALFRVETSEPGEAFDFVQELAGLVPAEEPGLRRAFSIWLARLFRRFSSGITIREGIDLEEVPMLEQTLAEWERKVRREARREGRQEGRQEGEVAGMQELLLEMMRQRFGPIPKAVQNRVEALSSPDELRQLSRKLLTAGSLTDLTL